jgi:hypothetical protein
VNNYGLLHEEKSITNSSGSDTPGDHMKFYAHTADGSPLRLERGEGQGEVSNCFPCRAPQARLTDRSENGWQPLAISLARSTGEGGRRSGEGCNAASLAKEFASPLGLPAEAELTGQAQGSASDSPAPFGGPPTGIVCSPTL